MLKVIKNLLIDCQKYRNDTNIYLQPFFIPHNNDFLENDKLLKDVLGIPADIPGIGVIYLNENKENFHKIVINKSFKNLPQWVQDALLAHEKGHIYYGIKNFDLYSKEYYEDELNCDLYSIEQGYDMYNALLYYMESHPILMSPNRIINLAKATNNSVPLYIKLLNKVIRE